MLHPHTSLKMWVYHLYFGHLATDSSWKLFLAFLAIYQVLGGNKKGGVNWLNILIEFIT